MALLTFATAPTKGASASVTLNKTELLALPEVSGDAFWSVSANIKSVEIVFKSTAGGQKKVLVFDFSQTSPASSLALSLRARTNFQIDAIVLQDFDLGHLTIVRSIFSVSTPSLTSLDFAAV